MDPILSALNESRQSTLFPLIQWAGIIVWVAGVLAFGMVLPSDVRADVRDALRHADISHKAAAHDMGISRGLLSRKLNGEKPLTLEALAHLPAVFWQWFAVALSLRYGIPVTVTAGARLSRRQARMALTHKHRRVVA